MRLAFAAALGFATLLGGTAQAASLCNCCGSDTAQSCATACAPVKVMPGQCVATVDFDAEAAIGPGQNPLYDIPLQNVWLDSSGKDNLEVFRRLMERARKAAEADRRKALAERRKGAIDAATADRLAKRYDDAMVNYYLGMQSYRIALSSGS
ncbi:hypothetical protein [Aestuariivirga sp.]|uniref:hypothetical protein n=1 Tax=Aestuariivirga sp. TaxID=2650926 RepID=UPI003593ADF7